MLMENRLNKLDKEEKRLQTQIAQAYEKAEFADAVAARKAQ